MEFMGLIPLHLIRQILILLVAKPKVSKLMMPSIFNNTSIEAPNDFSMLLTKENVQDYLNALSMQIKLSVK